MATLALFLLVLGLSSIAIGSKLLFIAPMRIGFLLVVSNLLYETLFKKLGWKRWQVDAAGLVALPLGWGILGGLPAAIAGLLLYAAVWVYALKKELDLLIRNPGEQDTSFGRGVYDRGGGWVPLPNPKLIALIEGPVWDRSDLYDLGDWPLGHKARFSLVVLNPTVIEPQLPLRIQIKGHSKIQLERHFDEAVSAPRPGMYNRARFTLTAREISDHTVDIPIEAGIGSYTIRDTLRIRSIFSTRDTEIGTASINRWRGGARGAFAWRGDMDLYDPATFQSEVGLRPTLELSGRYRIASTLFLSGRLSLVKGEHEAHSNKLGLDRNSQGINAFIRFLKEEVTVQDRIDFPYNTERPYAMEIGNHMYLHYDTHAAMADGNRWKNRAWIGDGRYEWQSDETGSFAEQRDNALANVQLLKETLDVDIRSWGVPGRAFDRETPGAVEASGMEVASDTDASVWINTMKLPPPHHPKGAEHLVELTKKYPGDPNNVYQVAMLKYWMALARRTRRAFIFMAHHHLLRYEGIAGTQCAEEVLRHAIADNRGDFYISTLYGLGQYWERVLCPKHRWVSVAVRDRKAVEVTNTGEETLENVPIEVTFNGEKQLLLLTSVPPKETIKLDSFSGITV